MSTNYSFAVGLLDASQNPSALQLWQSGTLTLDTASPAALSGVLALPGFYSQPIPFSGSQVGSTMAGTTIDVSGQSSEAQITATLTYNFDGFLYSGSYIAGLVSMLDYGAQETYLYVVQGLSPQGPFGAQFRSGTDKRVPRPA
jgi:hypothetical protein